MRVPARWLFPGVRRVRVTFAVKKPHGEFAMGRTKKEGQKESKVGNRSERRDLDIERARTTVADDNNPRRDAANSGREKRRNLRRFGCFSNSLSSEERGRITRDNKYTMQATKRKVAITISNVQLSIATAEYEKQRGINCHSRNESTAIR